MNGLFWQQYPAAAFGLALRLFFWQGRGNRETYVVWLERKEGKGDGAND